MNRLFISFTSTSLLLLCLSCDMRDDGVVNPLAIEDFPQVILFSDEGAGEVEDEDKIEIALSFLDRIDPTGEELGGTTVPLTADATVVFQIVDAEGFDNLGDYLLDWAAYYEVDDCTTSDDLGIDLNLSFDPATGMGSVLFPKEVEEIIIEFEVNDALFDDDIVNDGSRGFKAMLLSVTSAGDEKVVVNPDLEFEYVVLDDELIFGSWELDVEDADQFAAFVSLFGLLNEDIRTLQAEDVDAIEVEFKFDELSFVVVLKEEEEEEDCGEIELVNVEIEVEGGYESLTDDALEGEIEFADDIEQEDGSELEFVYKGNFSIDNDQLTLELEGEYDDETVEATLIFTR